MKFIEVDFGGELVHELLEDDGSASGGRCTRCKIDTKYYPGSRTDDPTLVVTCLRCAVAAQPSRLQPMHARRAAKRV